MPLNSPIYQVIWQKLVRWFIPSILRLQKLVALFAAMTSAINDLHTRFLYFNTEVAYRLAITPQVCYLRKALNDRYDFSQRRIQIIKGVAYDAVPFYLEAEQKPVYLFTKAEATPLVLYTKAETDQFTVDFVVQVPSDVVFDTAEMTEFINTYKLPTKTFTIQTV